MKKKNADVVFFHRMEASLKRRAARKEKRYQRKMYKRRGIKMSGSAYNRERMYVFSLMGVEPRDIKCGTARSGKLAVLRVPKNFSIIENPEGVIAFIKEIGSVVRKEDVNHIIFDHSSICNQDLGAEILLAKAVKFSRETARSRCREMKWSGYYPEDQAMKRLVDSIGVVSELMGSGVPDDQKSKMRLFKARGVDKNYGNPREQDEKTRKIDDFVDHINCCIDDHGYQLSPDGVTSLVSYVGEIISNAEEHAGDCHWHIYGYLDNNAENHFCDIVIYNYGYTIAESFENLEKSSYAMQWVAPYLDKHEKSDFWGKNYRKEDLLSVFALQARVSSKHIDNNSTRGNGTIELIQFFEEVAEEGLAGDRRANMCIMSGSTYIYFDGTYKIKKNASGLEVIAFNQSNDLEKAPDRDYVKPVRAGAFPGTLIAIRFPMSVISRKEAFDG